MTAAATDRITGVFDVGIDDETLARAVLTYCLDSADAMMYALIRGTGSAAIALQLIHDSGPGNHEGVVAAACASLDTAFIDGITRWGRTVNSRGMSSFHGSLASWQQRLASLPCKDPEELRHWFTVDGTQWIIAPHHPYWPKQISDLSLRTDWATPLCLWGKGDPQALVSCPSPVAIVGSRGVSDYGRQCAYEIARQSARSGHLIVSGGAMGADAAAHWGAIAAMDEIGAPLAGRTVAVFAGGLNHIGPKANEKLFDSIENHSGALISELCPETVPEARRFLLRNRLIAALSSTLIVAQARIRSGALNTAGWANELNRTLYAVPGDITMPNNTGCNQLIQEGRAIIICSLGSTNELCHEAHRPHLDEGCGATESDNPKNNDIPASDNPQSRESQETDGQSFHSETVLKAIRQCHKRNGTANVDMILAILREQHGGEYSIASVMQELGALELAGRISVQPDGINVNRAVSKAKQRKNVSSHLVQESLL